MSLPLLSLLLAAAVPAPPQFEASIDDPLLGELPPATQRVTSWDEALALVRSRSTDDKTALAGVDRAEARSRQALSALLPNARLTASLAVDVLHPDRAPLGALAGGGGGAVAAGTNSPSSPLGTSTASLTQPLFDLGAWRGLDVAEAGVRSAKAGYADVRRRLTQQLARSLVTVVAAERVAELNRLGLRQALERAALTKRTEQLGAATQLDVVRIEQDVAVARSTVVAGDEQLRRAREAFGLALGLDHDATVDRSFALGGLLDEAQASCHPIANPKDRPDLVAAREQVEAATASRLQALAGYLPTVGLTTSLFGYTTDPGIGQVASWQVSAVLSVPIWEGGLRGATVKERAALEEQAGQTLERARRDVTVEVTRARRSVDVAKGLLEAAREARTLAAKTDDMTRRSFEVGRSSSVELVQSAQSLRLADVTLAAREYEWVQARLDAFLVEAACDW